MSPGADIVKLIGAPFTGASPLTASARPYHIAVDWSLPAALQTAPGFSIAHFNLYRKANAPPDWVPTAADLYQTLPDNQYVYADTDVLPGETYCYAVTYLHDDCEGGLTESPFSNVSCAQICVDGCAQPEILITGMKYGSWIYDEYDANGNLMQSDFIDLGCLGFYYGEGVTVAPDGNSLYFVADITWDQYSPPTQTIVQTDLSGNLIGFSPIDGDQIENIGVVIPQCSKKKKGDVWIMKKRVIVWLSILTILTWHTLGQGFINLDFESARLIYNYTNYLGVRFVATTNALPGWSAFGGTNQQLSELPGDGVALVGPASGTNWVLNGNFSVLLGGGFISQTAEIPPGIESLFFGAYFTPGIAKPAVSLDGQYLSITVISNAVNSYGQGYTVYGADISAYSGQTKTLAFWGSNDVIDDIQFSSTPVPEPGGLVWLALGCGMLIYAHRKKRHC